MKYLIFCSCGHSLEQHSATGCAGDAARNCACRLDAGAALQTAVDAANADALASWGLGGGNEATSA